MITGIIRLVYFFQIDMFEDVTFHAVGTMTWTLVEPGVYLIAATLPSLRPLIRYLFKDIEFKALYKNLHNRYSRTFSKQKNSEGSMADKHYDTVARPLKAGTVGHVARSAGFVRIDERKTSGSNTSQQDI
ncbi:MAG: hypothetical protein LQ338_005088, partial [Usnochroma carphineum]